MQACFVIYFGRADDTSEDGGHHTILTERPFVDDDTRFETLLRTLDGCCPIGCLL